MRESIIYKIAIILSAVIHIGGFYLAAGGNHAELKNGYHSTADDVVIYEIGLDSPLKQIDGNIVLPAQKAEVREAVKNENLPKDADGFKKKQIKEKIKKKRFAARNGAGGHDRQNMGKIQDEYLLCVRKCIEKARFYPEYARKRLFFGTAKAGFRINDIGITQDVRIIKSSGFGILDDTAREIITRASPFPKPPLGWPGQNVNVTIIFEKNNGSLVDLAAEK